MTPKEPTAPKPPVAEPSSEQIVQPSHVKSMLTALGIGVVKPPLIAKPPESTESAADQNRRETAKAIRNETWWRRAFAIVLILVGIATVLGCLYFSFQSIDALVKKDAPWQLAIAGMAAHAVVAIAAIYFAYEMVRAAERLLIPRFLYAEGKDAEIINALTGIEPPTKAATKILRGTLGEVASVFEIVGKLQKTAHTIVAPSPPPPSPKDEGEKDEPTHPASG